MLRNLLASLWAELGGPGGATFLPAEATQCNRRFVLDRRRFFFGRIPGKLIEDVFRRLVGVAVRLA